MMDRRRSTIPADPRLREARAELTDATIEFTKAFRLMVKSPPGQVEERRREAAKAEKRLRAAEEAIERMQSEAGTWGAEAG